MISDNYKYYPANYRPLVNFREMTRNTEEVVISIANGTFDYEALDDDQKEDFDNHHKQDL